MPFMKITLFMCAGAIFVTTPQRISVKKWLDGGRMPVECIYDYAAWYCQDFVGFVVRQISSWVPLRQGQLLFGATLVGITSTGAI